MHWLVLEFRSPLASFGDVAIDSRGKTRNFPAKSMLVGLFANALGWTRSMSKEHQALQERIIFGAAFEEGEEVIKITDYQTVKLSKDDKSWSTRGKPIGRLGGAKTYDGSHQRWRDYLTDLKLVCVLRLDSHNVNPTLEDLAYALQYPARPLFIGRKSCLPSAPMFRDWIEAENVIDALKAAVDPKIERLKAFWPSSERPELADRKMTLTDERNWITGLHGGSREVCEGWLTKSD